MIKQKVIVKGVSLASAHHPNTLALTISGKEAYQITAAEIVGCFIKELGINWREIVALYQFEEPLKWFCKLGEEAEVKHFESVHCKTFQAGDEKQIHIEHLGREKRKVIVHWVPPTLPKEGVEEMLSFLSKDKVEAYPHKGRADRWTVMYRPEKETIVPHYIYLECGIIKDKRILLLVPGRKQACFLCGSQDHWTSRCLKRTPVAKEKINQVGVPVEEPGDMVRENINKFVVPETNPVAIPLEAPVVVPDAVPVTDPGAVLAGVSAIGSLPEPTKVLEEAISAIHMSTEMEDGWQIKRNKKNNKRIEPESTVFQSKGNSPMKLSYADAVSRGSPPLTCEPQQKTWSANKRHYDDDSEEDETKYFKYDWLPQDESTDESQ